VRLLERKLVYSGWGRFLLLEVELGDGRLVQRQIEDHGEAAAVLPFDPERRVALVCRRQLRGTGVEIVLHATRYDPSVPDRWWTKRSDIRWIVSELPKVLAYSVGLGA